MSRRNYRKAFAWALTTSLMLAALALTAAEAQPLSSVETGAVAPDFQLEGSDGKVHRLSDYRGSIVVLEWTSPICEVTAQYYESGKIQGLQKDAVRRKIIWLSINTAAPTKPGYLTPDAATLLTRKRGMTITAFLFDPKGAVGRLYGATATPSAYVINAKGVLIYQGAVAARPKDGANYLKAALDETVAGKDVTLPSTPQRGCPVEY